MRETLALLMAAGVRLPVRPRAVMGLTPCTVLANALPQPSEGYRVQIPATPIVLGVEMVSPVLEGWSAVQGFIHVRHVGLGKFAVPTDANVRMV